MRMTMTNMKRTGRAAAAAAVMIALALPVVAAGVPDALAKLKGGSDSRTADAMAQAGYQASGTKEAWDRKDTFWWHAGDRQCLRVRSRLGVVSGVATVAPPDCTSTTAPGVVLPGRPGVLTANDVAGLSRDAAERRLFEAGFGALWIDERPEGTTSMWRNQRTGQCIAALIVGNRFERADDVPTSQCK